jgi:hypothetical protein
MKRILLSLLTPMSFAACVGGVGDTGSADESTKTLADTVCPPPTLFEHGLCVCEDLAGVGEIDVLAGPAGVGSIGVNGVTNLVARAQTQGTWYAHGGFNAVGVAIGDSLVTPESVRITGDATIGGDADIGGDLTCVGELTVTGELSVAGNENVLGLSDIGSRGTYAAPAGPPCDCNPATFFDVEAAVAAAKTATNAQSSWRNLGDTEIHLTGGNYYVTAADVVGRTQIFVDASASVFVDGSLRSVGATQWKITSGATLDLFVSGDVASVGLLKAGSEADPDAFHLYVGGAGNVGVASVGASEFYGSLYAPRAAVAYVGDAKVVGSIFARELLGVGHLTIEYGDGASQPTTCPPPDGGGDGSGTGSGGSGDGSGGDNDGEGGPIFL